MPRDFEPVRLSRKTIERQPLFIVTDDDGVETVYDVPVTVPPAVTLDMLEDFRRGVEAEQVISQAIVDVVGEDGWRALRENVEDEDELSKIMGVLEQKLMAAQQAALGKSSRALRRAAG